MAKTSLNSTNKLQIFINPAGQGKTEITNFSQYGGYSLVFDEVAQKIYLAGNTYTFKTLTNDEYTSITNAVTTLTNTLNDQTSGSLANKIAALETALGTIDTALGTIDTNLDVNVGTGNTKNVKNALEALQDQIDTLQGTLNTGVVTISSGESTLTNTDAIKSAINAVKATGSDTASTASVAGAKLFATSEASNAQSAAVAAVVGNTTGKISSSTTKLDEGTIWKLNEEQTLTHLKDLINTLGGTDLAAVQDAITAIKNELRNTAQDDATGLLNTILDKLANFFNNETSWTMGSGITGATTSSATNVETIISTLEGYINSVKTTANAAVSDVKVKIGTGTAATIVTSNIATLEVAEGTTNGTVKIAGSDVAVHGLGGAAYKADNYYDVAGTASGLINALDSTPSQTAVAGNGQLSLSLTQTDGKVTAISGSIAANTYDAYGAASTVQTTVVGSAGDASSASTINGAKKYADEVAASAASTAAGQVITWEVIGSGS